MSFWLFCTKIKILCNWGYKNNFKQSLLSEPAIHKRFDHAHFAKVQQQHKCTDSVFHEVQQSGMVQKGILTDTAQIPSSPLYSSAVHRDMWTLELIEKWKWNSQTSVFISRKKASREGYGKLYGTLGRSVGEFKLFIMEIKCWLTCEKGGRRGASPRIQAPLPHTQLPSFPSTRLLTPSFTPHGAAVSWAACGMEKRALGAMDHRQRSPLAWLLTTPSLLCWRDCCSL